MDHGEEAIKKKAAKLLKVDESAIGEIRIVHRSIDARKKPQLLFSYIVDVMLANSKREGTVTSGPKASVHMRTRSTELRK